jgi:hypothetical protein
MVAMQRCCCQLLAEDRFPTIWMPSTELRDLRALLLHRHQWVRMRTRVQNALHAIAMAHGVRRGHTLWNREGQALLASLPLAPHTAHRRCRSRIGNFRPDSWIRQRCVTRGVWPTLSRA